MADVPRQTEASILDALRACFDPALALDIVEAGMVHAVWLEEDHDAPGAGIAGVPMRQRLRLELLPCSPEEDKRAQLQAQVLNRMAGVEALSRIEVALRDDPPWTPARITPAGRRTLGLDPAIFPILDNRKRP